MYISIVFNIMDSGKMLFLHYLCNGKKAAAEWSKWWTVVLTLLVINSDSLAGANEFPNPGYSAIVNITFKDPITGQYRTEKDTGKFGSKSRLDNEWGLVVHVRTADNQPHGCTPPVNVPKERWIALIERGECKFTQKIINAAVIKNASAVVIYNKDDDDTMVIMNHKVDDVVSIFIKREDGERIARLCDNGTRVVMHISVANQKTQNYSSLNKTSVLFVSISFIVLMIISLAWLVFYYIQRFRYAHAKERLSKRLMNAAKKAITKMPLRTVRSGDREIDSEDDQCAVCIETYHVSDVIRILPCKHVFHKSCIDPWLIEQRSCPMCKLDILKAYGLQVQNSRESVHVDTEGISTSISPSDLLHGRTSSNIDESAGITAAEVINFGPSLQAAQVDYHHSQEPAGFTSLPNLSETHACLATYEDANSEQQPLNEEDNKISDGESIESVNSVPCELQLLMSKHDKTDSINGHETVGST